VTRIPDTHSEAWALLPWLANGRLSSEDREWVDLHLQGCEECRTELADQRLVASHVNRDSAASLPSPGSDEQRSFNKLWARIDAAESAAPAAGNSGHTASTPRRSRTVRWLAAAVVVQAIGLGVLGLTLRETSGDRADAYQTMSVPGARLNAPAVSLAFAPQASMATINTLLTHQGLSIVAGPGASGNFLAELSTDAVASGASAESVAAVMSKDPNVTFAQPVAR